MNSGSDMAVSSMTGFARTTGSGPGFRWAWEGRSLNARGLELRFRLPPGLTHLEESARNRAAGMFSRGRVDITLTLQQTRSVSEYVVNRKLLEVLIDVADEYGGVKDMSSLLGIRGVIEGIEPLDIDEAADQARNQQILEGFDRLIGDMVRARKEEGQRLKPGLELHIEKLSSLAVRARNLEEANPEREIERLRDRLAALAIDDLSEERLAQEAAMIVVRGDVCEELDRLEAHVEAARQLLREGSPIGRRLDFLCQEFNREASTLCAKAQDIALTRIGLDLKAEVDRLREQAQNVE